MTDITLFDCMAVIAIMGACWGIAGTYAFVAAIKVKVQRDAALGELATIKAKRSATTARGNRTKAAARRAKVAETTAALRA